MLKIVQISKIHKICSSQKVYLVPLRCYVQKLAAREVAPAASAATSHDVQSSPPPQIQIDPSVAVSVSHRLPSSVIIPNVVAANFPQHQFDTTQLDLKGCCLEEADGNAKPKTRYTKAMEEAAWRVTPAIDNSKLLQRYLMLSKFRLTSLVVITSMAGYAVAPAAFDPATFVMCSVGTGLLSAAANSVNQFFEVPFDAQMARTRNRVLVKGYLTPQHAIGFALCSGVAGASLLYYGCNGLTAALGVSNLFLYTLVYTPSKRFSIINTWIGAVVGAVPPMMGWAACSGDIGAGAWILAGLLYAWQFPHFNALSWNLRPDYSRAGYRMMSVTDPGLCRRTALRYTGVLTGLCLAAPVLDVTNQWFALESLPLNGYLAYLAWRFYQKSDSGSSRKLFLFSLYHLPLLMVLFLLNKKRWIFVEKTEITNPLPALKDKLPNQLPSAPIYSTHKL